MLLEKAKEDLTEEIIALFIESIAWIHRDEVLLDADLTTELKIASDDLSIFAMDLEKHFDMRLTQNEWGRINTLQQAVDLVMEYRGVKLSQNSPEPGFWGKLWDCIK